MAIIHSSMFDENWTQHISKKHLIWLTWWRSSDDLGLFCSSRNDPPWSDCIDHELLCVPKYCRRHLKYSVSTLKTRPQSELGQCCESMRKNSYKLIWKTDYIMEKNICFKLLVLKDGSTNHNCFWIFTKRFLNKYQHGVMWCVAVPVRFSFHLIFLILRSDKDLLIFYRKRVSTDLNNIYSCGNGFISYL